jgi:uncharacterized repeat protein (TIGR01451 family)
MTSTDTNNKRPRGSWIKFLLLPFALLLLSAVPALADDCVADRGGLIDGFINPVPPSQINIDGNCTIRNFPASNPLTSNISFFTSPGQNNQRWLIIFDNVVHTGQMSCNSVLGHHIWFTNGSSTGIHQNCQNLLIPVEKINKQNPPGQTTASIGVPFTYRMTIPVLWDPATGTIINTSGSVNTLHAITITDDLNATGASLSYVSHTITWIDDGTPVPHSFSNAAGVLTFANFPIVAAGRQFVIALTVVLNNTPTNAPGTAFINTAKWEFGRLIDGTFYAPLPGEWGVTPPMTIAAPVLTATKSGPATMNLGQWGNFAINLQNIGQGDAWNATIRDILPSGPTGGMCSLTPEILSVQVFAADGVTPVAGKGPLSPGSGYSLSYSAAPNCQLDITTLTAAGRIGPNERLIVRYRTQLDSNTQNGVALTNIAGAIQWFNGDSSNSNRVASTRTLTNGTPGVLDHQDAHTVTAALSGYFFDKTVMNLTTGANPAVTAAPGDRLRYTLIFRATNPALSNFRIFDEPDALNAQAVFVPGSLALFSYPGGADISGTNSTGGTKGTGVIDIRNLNLPVNGTVQIQYDITLKPVLDNGTIVTNQSTARNSAGTIVAISDNPNVNGTADPAVSGDEDPTSVTIVSAPSFRVQKISTDLTGDPNTLVASDTLRYTITVKNIGNADAVKVFMRDAVPANTTYVAGSTTMNGVAVADVAGLSPLVNSMPINSPANATPGSMPADPSINPANVATIVFDVVVNSTVVNGMVISNQAFVTALGNGLVDVPSDDPNTPIANDPTRNIAGNLPLLYAEKKVALINDLGSPGVVDPGDVLRYTITVQNSAAISATNAFLKDAVPANLTYVANSTLLNGLPVGQPDGGASPLAAGINISSSNLTPPLPGAGAGTLSPGTTAVLQYDMRVNSGTPAGTLIRNQAVVTTAESPTLLTDGDGNAATGPEPTVVVVGVGQQLLISNQVIVVGGGPALPGAQLEYVVRVTNITSVPAINVVITDNLDASQPGQLAYVSGSSTMNGSASGISFSGSTITANYSSVVGQLAPGGVIVLRFRATLNPSLALNTVVTNTGVVVWNNPVQTASAVVSVVVGSVPGFAVLNGLVWHDSNFNDVQDSGERGMAGWSVDLYRDNTLWQTVLTDASGVYRILGVDPNDVSGVRYELRFRAPGAGANTAMLGRGVSSFTNGLQRISSIIASSGANLQGLNLSIHPNGVVYSSMARIPVAGSTLTLLDAASNSPLPASCFDDAAQQGQITLADGYYKFDINFSGPACPSGGDYIIGVTAPPGTNFAAGYSQIIPPTSSPSTAAFSVPACPGSSADAIPATALFCEVQPSEFAPGASIAPRTAGTNYYIHVMLDGSQTPGSSQIFNNHIPLDPQLGGTIAISKTTPLLNVTRGQLVPYVITVNNVSGQLLTDVGIVDRLPVGFTYVKGSAVLDGVQKEPTVVGRTLNWSGLIIAGTQVHTVKLLLVIGGGVSEGEFVNRAQAMNSVTSNAMSGEATATVRIVPDPTFDCTDVTGKVFNDANRNGRQDSGEMGLPGVRVVTTGGLWATTDQYGRYHITCAITPNESRGSNFALKLDDRTLPSGFRLSTDQVQIQRATGGKMLQLNFGASIHRVVGIDLSDAVFEPGTTEIRPQWQPRVDVLLEQLHKEPAVLRLSYVADIEDAALVERRVEAVKRQLTRSWEATKPSYALIIEPEVFWRRGAPPKRPDVRVQGSK